MGTDKNWRSFSFTKNWGAEKIGKELVKRECSFGAKKIVGFYEKSVI